MSTVAVPETAAPEIEATSVEELFSINSLSRAGGGARSSILERILDGRLNAVAVRVGGKRRFLITRDAALELIRQRANGRPRV